MNNAHGIQWTPDQIARFWSLRTQKNEQGYFSKHTGANVLRHVNKIIPLRKLHILDYGCGSGAMLDHLLARQIHCSGVEFADGSVETVNSRLQNSPYFHGVTLARALPTPLKDASFDILLCIEVVEHLTDEILHASLREMHRLLRPNGFLVITTPNEEDLERSMVTCPECGVRFHSRQHIRRWTRKSLATEVEKAGVSTKLSQPLYFARGDTAFMRLGAWVFSSVSKQTPHLLYIGQKS